MLGLSDGERISMIRSAVLIQYTHVTDGRTDGIGVAYTRYSIYAVVHKNCTYKIVSTDDKNMNKICKIKIHERKLHNISITVDGTFVDTRTKTTQYKYHC